MSEEEKELGPIQGWERECGESLVDVILQHEFEQTRRWVNEIKKNLSAMWGTARLDFPGKVTKAYKEQKSLSSPEKAAWCCVPRALNC